MKTLEKIQHLIDDCEYGKIDTAHCLVGIKDALHTAHPQPELTACDKILDNIYAAGIIRFDAHGTPCEIKIGDLLPPHILKTIRTALSAPSVQEVTVEEIASHVYQAWAYTPKGAGTRAEHANGVALFIFEAFPHGIRIVRGEGEKS